MKIVLVGQADGTRSGSSSKTMPTAKEFVQKRQQHSLRSHQLKSFSRSILCADRLHLQMQFSQCTFTPEFHSLNLLELCSSWTHISILSACGCLLASGRRPFVTECVERNLYLSEVIARRDSKLVLEAATAQGKRSSTCTGKIWTDCTRNESHPETSELRC